MPVTPGASIQDVVDIAAPGDVITVNAGTYDEDVTVDKRLTLRGEGDVIVNGGFVLTGTADGTTVENFIVNQGTDSVAINVNSVNDAVVRGCTVSGGIYGIYIQSATNCTVEGCTVSNVENNGIHLESAGQSQVLDNQVSGCGGGFSGFGILLYTNSPDCLISGNTVQGCTDRGIQIQSGCQGAVIESNICSGNNGGLRVSGCTGTPTVLRDNTVLGDHNTAVSLEGVDSVIVENVTARDGKSGIFLTDAENITLTNSTFTGFTGYGLFVFSGSYATNSLIANNLFNNTQNVLIPDKSVTTGTRWNTTQTAGENIRGGSFLGGNLWLTPDGTGFSQTRADFDLDGICDEGYDLGNGCTDSLPLQNGGPSASFSVTPSSVMTGIPVSFNDTSVGDPASWTWTFDEEDPITITDPADRNVTRTYDTADTYQATLTVKNEFGTNTTTRTVTIEPFSIQGAVNAAAPGDVVLVPSGTYEEDVTVNKNITLRGSENAVLNGRITIIGVDGATVEHLTVNGVEGDSAIELFSVSGCTVRDNTVTGGRYGISLGCGSSDCLVSGNHVEGYSNGGIVLSGCGSGNEVVANTCSGGNYGFEVKSCTGPNTLRDNIALHTNRAIQLNYPGSVVIENVTLKGGTDGVAHYGEDDLTLTNSTIVGFNHGLYFQSGSCQDHALIANNRFNNTNNVRIDPGADLSNVRWNTTKTAGENIRGGSFRGGNLWLTPEGTGFSQTHADFDLDGFCDEGYDLGNGCTDYLPLQNGGPSASFTVAPPTIMTGVPVSFNDTSVGDPSSWTWTFDGETETTRNVTHTYATAGTHQATLTVKNEFGTNTTTCTLDVTPYTIQGAVDAAAPGDVVLVPAGEYTESVRVDKNITLRGSEGAVLNGRITITSGADGATVENLTVNCGGITSITLSGVSGCTVRNNTVTGGYSGICLDSGSSNCLVSGNRVEGYSQNGICIKMWSSGNEIVANTCSGGFYGFHIENCRGPNTLRDNTVLNATNGINLPNPGPVVIENVTMHIKPGGQGVIFSGNDALTLTNSIITGASVGLSLSPDSGLDHMLIANNLFNNTQNLYIGYGADLSGARWNTTKTAGENIRGGPSLGGNLWLTPEGTGFSETHLDLDGDGICDERYDLGAGCIDHLPLHTCLPTANFTVTPAGGSTPLEVQFADASSGVNPRTYSWDFGDATSDQAAPSHTFTTNGTYQVSLTVTNDFGSDTTTRTVTALDPPIAVISTNLTEGNAPLTVQFTDDSTGCVFTRLWDFDDRTNATAAGVSHTFENPGTYNVTLNASNPYASAEAAVKVVVLAPPEANFTFTPTAGNTPLTVTFNETTTGDVDTWAWDFGDGTPTVSGRNVTHTFNERGTFPVTLTASNAFGSNATTRTVTVHAAPAAGFDLNVSEGNDPLTVLVTNTSTGDFTKCVLDFGDGTGTVVMSGETAAHTFARPDTYTITLNASNAYGFNRTTSTVTVHAAPAAGFDLNVSEGNDPLTVLVTNTSTGDFTKCVLDFGDGTGTVVMTGETAAHTFARPDTYTITLNASNAYGFNRTTSTVTVLPPPVAAFTQNIDEGNAPLTVAFTDGSTGNVTAWQWDFGDGNVSTEENPSHEYVTPGTYPVVLNASNVYGFSLSDSTVTILAPPKANFTQSADEGNAPLAVTFTDGSTGNVTSWQWDFGDGNVSTEENPSHEYVTAGTYTVQLNASNAYGFSLSESSVTILAPPLARFGSKVGADGNLREVAFTDRSTGNITAWQWEFGDGASSTNPNPVHTYAEFGTYNVTLSVRNAYDANATTAAVTLTTPSSHGGRSPASAGAASKIPAGGHASFGVRESAIHEVTVTASDAISRVLVTVEPTTKPNSIEAPADAVYEYDQVTLYHTTEDALAGAAFDFTVPKTWLDEQGAGPDDVVLYRYHDGAWHALPTSVVSEDESGYSFTAESPGFAFFAIGADGRGVHPSAGTNVTRPTPDVVETVTTAAATTAPATTPQQQTPLPWWLAAVAAGAAVALRHRR